MAGRTKSNNGDVTDNHGENDYWVVKLGACGVNTALTVDEYTIQSSEAALSSAFQWIDCNADTIITGETLSAFTPATGGNYAVIVTNGSCIDTSACINICPLNANVMVVDNSLQAIENSPDASFQWVNCSTDTIIEGEVDPIFEPATNGEYALIVSEENCSVTSECFTVCPENINTSLISTEGTILSLADTLLYSFQWMDCSNGMPIDGQTGQLFTPITSGDYAVIVSQGNCSATSDCITFCLINTDISVIDNTIQVIADPLVTNFQWIDCSDTSPIEGETSPIFTPTVNGDYAVIIMQGSCADTSDCVNILLVDWDEPIQQSSKIFPNPVQDFLIIETDLKMSGAIYRIYDPSGQQISKGKIETTNTKIDTSDLPYGAYLIQLESQHGILSKQFIKS
jgi:NAD-dependent dihydropyrimidine dehydrogenase PreA subunit